VLLDNLSLYLKTEDRGRISFELPVATHNNTHRVTQNNTIYIHTTTIIWNSKIGDNSKQAYIEVDVVYKLYRYSAAYHAPALDNTAIVFYKVCSGIRKTGTEVLDCIVI